MKTQHAVQIMNAVAIMRLLPAEENIRLALDTACDGLMQACQNSDIMRVANLRSFLRKVQNELVMRGKLNDLLLRDALFGVITLLQRR